MCKFELGARARARARNIYISQNKIL